ncbi:CoA transferase [Parahaliea maris]|uniref:CoA transferase n=1 Tax=Parahaliea maris TaxID=2716870 RepID=A0A5C9A4I3_9GAMM|nr:CoA transferase [Parahaliea maris]TXS95833.1 CoA transferase [Parahaliea maris]
MSGVLDGLRVLDLSWGLSGPKVTMMLADHGADVTRIEAPDGEPFERPLGYRVWQRGKRSATLDLTSSADLAVFRQLAGSADILLESFEPGVTKRLGIDYDSLSPTCPQLIYCSITGYGRDNSHASRPGYDMLVAARTGLLWETRGWNGSSIDRIVGLDKADGDRYVPDSIRTGSDREGPLFPATEAPSILAAYLALLGISAALRARELTGRGQWVETSLLQGIIMGQCCSWQRPEHPDAKGYVLGVSDPRQTWGIVRAKDGYMCTWASPTEWFEEAGASDTLVLPQGDLTRTGMASLEERNKALERLAPTFAKFTVAQWTALAAGSGGVSCQPVRTPEEALCDPALLQDGTVVVLDDPELGPLHQAGLVYRMHSNMPVVRGGVAKPGEHTEAVRAEAAALAPQPARAAGGSLSRGPLQGIRVADFGLAVAGPWCTQLLADLGAEVIKIDPSRNAFWMGCNMSLGVNRSKRSLGLDSRLPEGQVITRKLIEDADVIVHNMRPQAAKKLGLDYASLREINPRVVFAHTRGFEDGPRSLLPGNDQTANSLGGTVWEDGGCWNGGRPWFGATSNGDLGNGFLAAIAVIQALYAREKTGMGQAVDASILSASIFNNSRVYTTPDGRHFPRPVLDSEQLGFNALYRLYRCREGWICLAVANESHWQALTTALPELAENPAYATSSARAQNNSELEVLMASRLASASAMDWFERLDRAGVPCEISAENFSRELFDNAEFLQRGWIVRCEGNTRTGTIDMFGSGIDFSDTPCQAGGPPPTPWQHTGEILGEFGYSAEAIEALYQAGVAVRPQD